MNLTLKERKQAMMNILKQTSSWFWKELMYLKKICHQVQIFLLPEIVRHFAKWVRDCQGQCLEVGSAIDMQSHSKHDHD